MPSSTMEFEQEVKGCNTALTSTSLSACLFFLGVYSLSLPGIAASLGSIVLFHDNEMSYHYSADK